MYGCTWNCNFCKLKYNIFNLGPFCGAHGVDCRLRIRRMVDYLVLSNNCNMEAEKG